MSRESALASAAVLPTPSTEQPPVAAVTPALGGETAASDAGVQPLQGDAARFAALARKEAQLVRERDAFKKDQEAYKAKEEKLTPWLKRAQEYEERRAKGELLQAFQALGFSETDLFNIMANLEPPKELSLEERAIKAAEAAADKKIKSAEEAQAKRAVEDDAKRDAALITGLKTELSKYLDENKEKLEYSAFHGKVAEDLAYNIIVEGLRESEGKDLITAQEALQMAEDFYEERDKAMSTLKKRQPKDPDPVPAAAAPQRTRTVTAGDPTYKQPPVVTRTRTLSNDARVTSASTVPKNETRDQKRERLIAQIKANGLRK